MSTPATVRDVDTAGFAEQVVARSHEVPVVVDFWAAWCGPCRTLGPTLEAAVAARGGRVELAKVDVDANPQLAQEHRVQGIPAVKAWRDGQVVAEFTGAVNASQVEAFLDQVVPSEADRLAALGAAQLEGDPDAARAAFEAALDAEPRHPAAGLGLAELLLGDDPGRARDLVALHRPDPRAEALLTRLDLAADDGDVATLTDQAAADPVDAGVQLRLGRALAAEGDHGGAIEALLRAVEIGGEQREVARAQLVALFDLLGDDERVLAARPRLARALF